MTSAGHVHAYERSFRVFDNKVDECGPVHIVIGDGGNREVRLHFFPVTLLHLSANSTSSCRIPRLYDQSCTACASC